MDILADVTVLDLSRAEQGPLACVHLADMGARVIKVEPPEGESTRASGTAFIAHNRGKQAVTVNLRSPQGREFLDRLVGRADVLVHNYTFPVAERLGVGYERLKELNPQLIYVWASGFGATGPRRDELSYDIIGQAVGGIVSVTGERDGRPLPAGAAISDATGAMNVLQAVLLGLYRRLKLGVGSEIVTSLYGGQLAIQSWEILSAGLAGKDPGRAGNGHPQMPIWGIFATRDGHIALGGLGDQRWPGFCRAVGLAELAEDGRFALSADRMANKEALTEIVSEALTQYTTAELLQAFREANVIAAPVQSYHDIMADDHAWQNGYLQRITHAQHGDMTVVGTPFTIDGKPLRVKGPPPELGQDTELIMNELGYSWDEIRGIREAGGV